MTIKIRSKTELPGNTLYSGVLITRITLLTRIYNLFTVYMEDLAALLAIYTGRYAVICPLDNILNQKLKYIRKKTDTCGSTSLP